MDQNLAESRDAALALSGGPQMPDQHGLGLPKRQVAITAYAIGEHSTSPNETRSGCSSAAVKPLPPTTRSPQACGDLVVGGRGLTAALEQPERVSLGEDRKSTRLNSSHT